MVYGMYILPLIIHAYIVHRVNRLTVDPDLKMTVIACSPAGLTDIGNDLSLHYLVSDVYRNAPILTIPRDKTVAMVHNNTFAVAVVPVSRL